MIVEELEDGSVAEPWWSAPAISVGATTGGAHRETM
jgi:hypothetical protein